MSSRVWLIVGMLTLILILGFSTIPDHVCSNRARDLGFDLKHWDTKWFPRGCMIRSAMWLKL